jgi:hypothetical protein
MIKKNKKGEAVGFEDLRIDRFHYTIIATVDDGRKHLSVSFKNKALFSKLTSSISWDILQQIKNIYYPDIDFVEYYPDKTKTVYLANVRHLWESFN